MVYDWAQHRHVITRLYVDESKPVDEIIRHMRTHYGFTPRYVASLLRVCTFGPS